MAVGTSALIDALSSEDPLVAMPAARELAQSASRVVAAVVERPRASAEPIPLAAVRHVLSQAPEPSAALLRQRVLSADRDFRAGRQASLDLDVSHRPFCQDALGKALEHAGEDLAGVLFTALGNLGACDWKFALDEKLEEDPRDYMGDAIRAFAELFRHSRHRDVAGASNSLRRAVERNAEEKLGGLTGPLRLTLRGCSGDHVDTLIDDWLGSPHPLVRRIGADALGDCRFTRAIPALADLFVDPDGAVRNASGLAAGTIGTKDAVEALRREGAPREGMAFLLHRIPDEGEFERRARELTAGPWHFRWAVWRAIGLRGDAKGFLPALREAASAKDPLERGCALVALARCGEAADRDRVVRAEREASRDERTLAMLALLAVAPERYPDVEGPLRELLATSYELWQPLREDVVAILEGTGQPDAAALAAAWRPFYGHLSTPAPAPAPAPEPSDSRPATVRPAELTRPAAAPGVPAMAWFEDLPLDFTKHETRTAEQLLKTGYSTKEAAIALAQDAGLDPAALDPSGSTKQLVREILKKARLSNRLVQLLAEVLSDPEQDAIRERLQPLIAGHEAAFATAAVERKPSIATLALMPSSLEVWWAGPDSPRPLADRGEFERIVNTSAAFSDVAVFRTRLAEAEVRTARIDVGGKPRGTGFLVGARLVLTNWHVVEKGVDGAVATFDEKVLPSGKELPGRAVPFAADWLAAHSDHASKSDELSAQGPPAGLWDFALVRLAEPVGDQGIGADPDAPALEPRGWYRLDGSVYAFEPGEPLLVVGHPKGRPIQLSYASPSGVELTPGENRIRYQTNTDEGSSGSPVFNEAWRVVALHHAGGATSSAQPFNQGVPIQGVVQSLKEQLDGKPELAELSLN